MVLLYTAAFLTPESKQVLLRVFPTERSRVFCDLVTLSYQTRSGDPSEQARLIRGFPVGHKVLVALQAPALV